MASQDTQSPVVIAEANVDDLRTVIGNQRQHLYAVLDACDEPRVLMKVQELGPQRAVSLYRGSAAANYRSIAPYLVVVDEHLLDWIVTTLWNDPWGIFVASEGELTDVRDRLRRFLTVNLPDGRNVYFRFYDPRLITSFLGNASRETVATFFEGVSQVICQIELGKLISVRMTSNVERI